MVNMVCPDSLPPLSLFLPWSISSINLLKICLRSSIGIDAVNRSDPPYLNESFDYSSVLFLLWTSFLEDMGRCSSAVASVIIVSLIFRILHTSAVRDVQ